MRWCLDPEGTRTIVGSERRRSGRGVSRRTAIEQGRRQRRGQFNRRHHGVERTVGHPRALRRCRDRAAVVVTAGRRRGRKARRARCPVMATRRGRDRVAMRLARFRAPIEHDRQGGHGKSQHGRDHDSRRAEHRVILSQDTNCRSTGVSAEGLREAVTVPAAKIGSRTSYLSSTAILSAGWSLAFCSVWVAGPDIRTSSAFAPG